ncbi:MAG: hypothetical protein KF855_16625 [Acidobacteria bacterium]|nr:hypothetical protein [Acidobacteriota bacterium]
MYDYSFWSPVYLALTAAYFLVASVVTFDIRLNQAKQIEDIDYGTLPAWVTLFYYFQWLLWITLAILNWKWALVIFIIKFVLKILPVLETIGNFLMFPFSKDRNTANRMEEVAAEKHLSDLSPEARTAVRKMFREKFGIEDDRK